MSLSIARMVDRGGSPVAEAAMAKDLGTELEQLLVDELWHYRYEEIKPGPDADRFHEFLDINRLRSPVFTTAGGTNEVLRLLVGRQLPGWAGTRKGWALRSPLAAAAFEQAAAAAGELGRLSVPRGAADPLSARLFGSLRAAGFLGVSVPEDLGGSGGSLNDALDVVRGAAYAGAEHPRRRGPDPGGLAAARGRDGLSLGRSPAPCSPPATSSSRTRAAARSSPAPSTPSPGRRAPPRSWYPVRRDGELLVATVAAGALGLPPGGANTAGEPVARRCPARPRAGHRRRAGRPGVRRGRRGTRPAAGAGPRGRDDRRAAAHRGADHRLRRPAGPVRSADRPVPGGADAPGQAGRRRRSGPPSWWTPSRPPWTIDDDLRPHRALVAAARTLAGDAAIVGARTAHQVHGAIGVTMEYPLQRFTRRLWEWEAGDGTAARWARQLGAEATDGALRTWQLITGTY